MDAPRSHTGVLEHMTTLTRVAIATVLSVPLVWLLAQLWEPQFAGFVYCGLGFAGLVYSVRRASE
jgi:hypothetical protein